MVILGTIFPVVFLLFLFYSYKENIQYQDWLLYLGILCVPLGYVAQQAGWVVAEVGRQPWAIQGLLPVSMANSNLTTGAVQTTFFLFLGLFTLLMIAEISIMVKQIQIGPEGE
jgi:cytochrome d ubiquinol oxidase subunit I